MDIDANFYNNTYIDTNIYTKTNVDNLLLNKVDTSTLNSYYTKHDVDTTFTNYYLK